MIGKKFAQLATRRISLEKIITKLKSLAKHFMVYLKDAVLLGENRVKQENEHLTQIADLYVKVQEFFLHFKLILKLHFTPLP